MLNILLCIFINIVVFPMGSSFSYYHLILRLFGIGMCLAKEGSKAWVSRMCALITHFKSRNAAFEQHDIDVLPAFGTNEILIDAAVCPVVRRHPIFGAVGR